MIFLCPDQGMDRIVDRVVLRHLVAAGLGIGKTWSNGRVRIHRFANSYHVWDLTNAGKRGKKVPKLTIMYHKGFGDEEWLEQQSRTILLNASSFGAIHNLYRDDPEARVFESEERGIDVVPDTTKPLAIQWKVGDNTLDLKATPLEFNLSSTVPLQHPKTGDNIGVQTTLYWSESRTAAKRFYAWLAAGGDASVQRLDIMALRDLWRSIDVDYDYH